MNRRPPVDLDAERDAIASCLLDKEAWEIARDSLAPDGSDFYSDVHARIWEAMHAAARSESVDLVSVGARLTQEQREALDKATSGIPNPRAIETRCRRLRDLAAMRAVVTRCHELAAKAYDGVSDPAEWLDEAEHALQHAAQARRYEDGVFLPLSAAIDASFGAMSAHADRGGGPQGHTSGLVDLDKRLSGFVPGALYIVAGRPGSGKSGLVKDIVFGVIESSGKPAVFASLEMPLKEVGDRAIVSAARVNYSGYRSAQLSPEELRRSMQAAQDRYDTPLFVSEQGGMTLGFLSRWSRRLKRRHGELSMVVVDYLQLMGWAGGRAASREERVAENSRGLKGLAKELGCPVVAVSALNRVAETRANKRPSMADLRESGAIEYDADAILLIDRDGSIMRVNVAKNRSGETGAVELRWTGAFVRADNLDNRHGQEQCLPEDHYGRWPDD